MTTYHPLLGVESRMFNKVDMAFALINPTD